MRARVGGGPSGSRGRGRCRSRRKGEALVAGQRRGRGGRRRGPPPHALTSASGGGARTASCPSPPTLRTRARRSPTARLARSTPRAARLTLLRVPPRARSRPSPLGVDRGARDGCRSRSRGCDLRQDPVDDADVFAEVRERAATVPVSAKLTLVVVVLAEPWRHLAPECGVRPRVLEDDMRDLMRQKPVGEGASTDGVLRAA
jgi:hypothetical protein